MEQKKRIIRITRTAVFLALLIVLQAATAPLGNTLLTGSVVNFLLITSVMLCGPASGFTVAVLSPVLARFLGIGPLWALIPFIIAGNITICAVWYLVAGRGGRPGISENAWQWREALRQRRRYCMEGLPVSRCLTFLYWRNRRHRWFPGCFPFLSLLRPWREGRRQQFCFRF